MNDETEVKRLELKGLGERIRERRAFEDEGLKRSSPRWESNGSFGKGGWIGDGLEQRFRNTGAEGLDLEKDCLEYRRRIPARKWFGGFAMRE